MTALAGPEAFIVKDLFSKLYQHLAQRSLAEKWLNKKSFTEEWVEFYSSSVSYEYTKLHSTIGADYTLFQTAFDVLNTLSKSGNYQEKVLARVQSMKQECTLVPETVNCAMEVDQTESMSLDTLMIEDSLMETKPVPNSPQLSCSSFSAEIMVSSSPGRYSRTDEELIRTLLPMEQEDYPYDMDHSTSIISYSTDHHPDPVEDVREVFEYSGIVDSSPPQSSDPQIQEVPLSNALSLLRRISRKKKSGHPKKEYFRCQHIRALKKSLRQLDTGKIPGTSIHRVNKNNDFQMEKWTRMREFFTQHREELRAISDTAAGPTTDGKKKRGKDSNDPKSFNNEYCRRFFEPLVVRTYNTLFCELVYEGNKPVDMCGKMKAKCCESPVHTDVCQNIWARVYAYAKEEMLEELGLKRQEQSLPIEDFLQVAA